ncbi:hypothetical protein ISF_09757 [Cordyceps fumosorosea ARSEF 2679]|uniref:Uncharacterized protein n=1 Tax=Cordyceps fumosorosea (strain ARSEF 2679) TaxID=1081104 RepID=A0A167D198_CORFA|nr:hypothetical protein ISF_09757 [Cordyceps fumosorosea ARSEF 2679]OAA41829.1 hypothetical protein ISF_09757 [Cordyceps fumosorosea ARSEF 2679]
MPTGETAEEPGVSLPSVYVPPPRRSDTKDDATVFEYDGSDYIPPGKGPASATRWSWPRRPRHEASSDCKSDPAGNKTKAWKKYREWARNRINHDGQLHEAVHRAQDQDRREGLRHPEFGTIDCDAVSSVQSWATVSNAPLEEEPPREAAVPACLPGHRQHVRDAKSLARYLAASAYTISLAGPPLADMQYGVVIVPCGQEELFFREPEEPAYEKPLAASVVDRKSERPALCADSETSMGSTAFRFFDKQRLLEMWQEDRWNAEVREERKKIKVEELLVPPEPWDPEYVSCLAPEPQPWTSEEPQTHLQWDSDSPKTVCATASAHAASWVEETPCIITDLELDGLTQQITTSTEESHRVDEVVEAASICDATQQSPRAPSSCNGQPARVNGPALDPVPTAQQPLSVEGRLAIEKLLRSAVEGPTLPRKQSKRRSIRAVLRRKRAVQPNSAVPSGAVSQLVLREVAAVTKMIADGSMMENPGIDDGLWTAVQQGLRSR